jgi:hypothetical protein
MMSMGGRYILTLDFAELIEPACAPKTTLQIPRSLACLFPYRMWVMRTKHKICVLIDTDSQVPVRS